MFFVAHTLAFQLHWPSRYTHHTFKMVLALASGIALTLMLDAAFHWSEQLNKSHQKQRQILVLFTATLVGAGLILYPSFLKVFPSTPYVVGREPALYEFLQQQPKDSLIASLASEADNLPAFAQRSILVGREYALPFHTRYYKQFRQRVIDLIDAQYSLDINQAKSFIHKYGVSFWLLERTAFQPEYVTKNSWIKQYQPAADEALAKLKQRAILILLKLMKPCAVFETQNLVVLKATCLENSQQK